MSWKAACLQIAAESVGGVADRAAARSIVDRNVARATARIEQVVAEQSPDLILLPEYALQGAPRGESAGEWAATTCESVPGDLTWPFQALAARHGVFIGAQHFETDVAWPGRYFNTAFLIDRQGEVILRYRRINTALYPSPHDVRTEYLDRYGIEGTFPVVETELGRIAMLICGDLLVPEAARVLMMRGAEVILHPTNEPAVHDGHASADDAAKIARAAENMVYVISANAAGRIAFDVDGTLLGGRSQVVDYRGAVLSLDAASTESLLVADIDIEALRRARGATGMENTLLRLRLDMYEPVYRSARFYPHDGFADAPSDTAEDLDDVVAEALANLARHVLINPSPSATGPFESMREAAT